MVFLNSFLIFLNFNILDVFSQKSDPNKSKEPFLGPSSFNDIIKYDLNQHFIINKQNLNNFMIQANHIKDMPINMRIFKSYFKVPFEVFPESMEIMDIFSKIIQRFDFFRAL